MTLKIRNKEALISLVSCGKRVEYTFFWGHRKPKRGVSKTCFSQWYHSPFESEGEIYQTAEHYMMAGKAKLFGDNESFEKILLADYPSDAKKIGRNVKNFDEHMWDNHRSEIVISANLAKFSQHSELRAFLLNTGNSVLVEASPVDKIWGIGLAADDPAVQNPNKWKGLNLLGFALMDVRGQLSD